MLQDPTFWVAVSFFIFLGIVWVAGRKPIVKAFDDYAASVKREMEEASALYEEARFAITEIQMKHTNSVREADAILAAARQQSQLIRAQAEKDLDGLLARREKQALERISILEDQVGMELRARAVDTAIRAAEHLLRTKPDTARDAQLIDRQIGDLAASLRKVA